MMESKGPQYIGPERMGVPRPPIPPWLKKVFSGGMLGWRAAVLMVLALLGLYMYFSFTVYIRPYEYGLKEVKIALRSEKQGIQEKVYEPGLAFVMPFGFQRMHRLPRQVQLLEMSGVSETDTASRASKTVFRDSEVKIQTSDGFSVNADITVIYRIVDPYLVLTTLGPDDMYLQQGVRPKAEPILKETLGQLTTEEFYNSLKRTEKAELAKTRLNEEMTPKGINVQQVLIRYFRYSDRIQKNIEEKKLQDQLVFTNQSKKKSAEQQKELNRVTAEGKMQVEITMEQGKAYCVQKKAEQELYTRKKEAEGDLITQLAEAKSTEMRNAAMQVAGSERMVALKMADVLQGLEVVIAPTGGETGFNPMNLDSLMLNFGLNNADTAVGAPVSTPSPAAPETVVPAPPAPETPAMAPATAPQPATGEKLP